MLTVLVTLSLAAVAHANHIKDGDAQIDAFGVMGLDDRKTCGPLQCAWPITNFQLDVHPEVGLSDATRPHEAGWNMMMHGYAQLLWLTSVSLTQFTTKALLMSRAFDLTSLGVEAAGDASRVLHQDVFGVEWQQLALACLAIWAAWTAFGRRRFAEAGGGVGKSILFFCLAMLILTRPVATITSFTNQSHALDNGFLVAGAKILGQHPGGDVPPAPTGTNSPSRKIADWIFRTRVLEPYAALNFGNLEYFVDSENRKTEELVPGGRRIDNRERVPYWVALPLFSGPRWLEYEAANAGKVPSEERRAEEDDDWRRYFRRFKDWIVKDSRLEEREHPRARPGQFDGRNITQADEYAVQIQKERAGTQRAFMASWIFVGNLSSAMTIGLIAAANLIADWATLFFAVMAFAALVAALVPWLHGFFEWWARGLFWSMILGAVLSFLLTCLLVTLGAVQWALEPRVGWGTNYMVQALILWSPWLAASAYAMKRRYERRYGVRVRVRTT